MKLSREYLGIADVAVKEGVDNRTILQYLYVERVDGNQGRVTAADGFVLAVVPCTLEDDDVPGLLHPAVLKLAAKESPKRSDEIWCGLEAETARLFGGVSYPRLRTTDVAVGSAFPDYRRITPVGVDTGVFTAPSRPLAFNHKLLDKIGKALGGVGVALWPNPKTEYAPIVATPINGYGPLRFEGGLPVPPYGVVMPMHCKPLEAYVQRHQPGPTDAVA